MRKDGSRVQVSVTISPILGTRGEVIGAAAITRDVSERRRIEEALRDSEERYRGIVRQAAVGIARAGLDGRLLDANPGLCQAVAREREELVGTSYLDLVHADDRARAGAAIETLLAGGPDGETLDLRYRRNQRDSVWVSVTLSAIRSAEGKPRSVIAVSLDVTERRRTEATLRFLAEASESLSSLVDYRATLQKVAQLAVPGFADWCAVDMLGDHGDDRATRGGARRSVQGEAGRDDPRALSARSGRSLRRTESAQDRCLGARGRDRPTPRLERACPTRSAGGSSTSSGLRSYMCVPLRVKERTLGVMTFVAAESGRHYDDADLGAAEDLARRAAIAIENARLYQELRDSDRRKDEFLAVLSHELRNPLAPIRSGIDMLAMDGQPGTAPS